MEVLGGAILALAITVGAIYYLVAVNEPSKTRRDHRHARSGDARSIESKIEGMERRAAELEQQLTAIDAEEFTHDDAASRDWAANASGPSFEMGPADIPVLIDYRDASGRDTSREITVKSYSYEGANGRLLAYCHARGAQRTFLFSRITTAADPHTGESITSLGPWLDHQFQSSDIGAAAGALERHQTALSVMLYVAKADNAFRQREKTIMREFLIDEGASTEAASAVVDAVSRWATPSAVSYGKALRALAPTPADYRRRVKRAAVAMIASDKTVHDKESNALKRLEAEVRTD